jgi:hypothetical protein
MTLRAIADTRILCRFVVEEHIPYACDRPRHPRGSQART